MNSGFTSEARGTGSGRKYSAPAAACAADVLQKLAQAGTPQSVADLARLAGGSRSLVFRVLRELELRDLVERAGAGRYRLGTGVLELGGAFVSGSDFGDSARRALRWLSAEVGETANLGVLRGRDVLYVMKQEPPDAVLTISQPGKRLPANCSALGKALLSHLSPESVVELFPEPLPRLTARSITDLGQLLEELALVRESGFAVEHSESVGGRGCVATLVVLPGREQEPAAISVSAWDDGFADRVEEFSRALALTRDRLAQEARDREALSPGLNQPLESALSEKSLR